MNSELLNAIIERFANAPQRVVVVDDPDGLLTPDAVRCQLGEITGRKVVTADGIRLRVHYELNIRRDTDAKVLYIRQSTNPLQNDIARVARKLEVTIGELFPNFEDRETLKNLDFDKLSVLYAKHLQGWVTARRLQEMIRETSVVAEPIEEVAVETIRRSLETPDWSDTAYVESVGKALKRLFSERKYDAEMAKAVADLNFDFQHYLHDSYFATLNSAGGPKAVHGVIPYIEDRFNSNDKVALVVVDGMAWWQWEVLRDVLDERKLLGVPKVKAIMAWLPSITALSRQALFRGDTPQTDYRQTPIEEEKLWKHRWMANPIFAPVYQHNVESAEELNTASRRLALVDVQLDKKMHQSSDYYDLHDLIRNWAVKFADIIARLREEGFKIVLTTDHGNVLATGVGTLNPEEKVHLYLDNSRGERFVYFNSKDLKDQFRNNHYMLNFFSHPQENWLAIANDASFSTNKKQLITHGGSHFMETVIPLIIF